MQKVQITLEDDLDGGPADETVQFALDGVAYEIDLSTTNASKLRDMLEPFVVGGRKLAKGGKPFRRVTTTPDSKVVRLWATANGIDCPDRGRVPRSVMEAYQAAV